MNPCYYVTSSSLSVNTTESLHGGPGFSTKELGAEQPAFGSLLGQPFLVEADPHKSFFTVLSDVVSKDGPGNLQYLRRKLKCRQSFVREACTCLFSYSFDYSLKRSFSPSHKGYVQVPVIVAGSKLCRHKLRRATGCQKEPEILIDFVNQVISSV